MSRYYPVMQPPVAGTPEQLQDALQQVGAALVKTGEFLKAVPSPTSLPQRSTRSSRAASTVEISMTSLDQIRNPHNTSWVAIVNDGKDNSGPRLRKTSLTSEDNWQKAGANWLKETLEPLVLNASTWCGDDCTGPRTYQPAGLLRLKGVARQRWHADAAQANSLPLHDSDALPLSALHPLSPEGTTILIVPSDTRVPSQVYVPPGYVLIWRGDLEHAGDEFLCSDNLALFTYIFPPAALFVMERDLDGATLTFGTGREHSQLVLPIALRGYDQGASVGPIGSFATFTLPEDKRVSHPYDLTEQLLSIQVFPPSPPDSPNPSDVVELQRVQLGTDVTAENATAVDAALSGTASPDSSTALDASSAAQLNAFLADMNAEYGSQPPSPQPTLPTWSPTPDAGVHPCGDNQASSWASEWTPASLRDNGMYGQQSAAVSAPIRCILAAVADLPAAGSGLTSAADATEIDMPLAQNIPGGCEGLPLADAHILGPVSAAVEDAALSPSDVLELMETSLGADHILTSAQAVFQAQQEGLVLTVSSSSGSGFANVQLNKGSSSKPFRAFHHRHGVRSHLGSFSTPEEAALHVARAQAQALLDDAQLLLHLQPASDAVAIALHVARDAQAMLGDARVQERAAIDITAAAADVSAAAEEPDVLGPDDDPVARGRAIQAALDTPAHKEYMRLREAERERNMQSNQAVLVSLGLGQGLVPPRPVAPPLSATAMGKRPAPQPSSRKLRAKAVYTGMRAEGREPSEQPSDESREQSDEEFSPSEESSGDERRRGGPSGKVARVTSTGKRKMRANDAPVPLQSQAARLHDSAAVPSIRANATSAPTAQPYAYATSLSRPRGLHETRHRPALVSVSLPDPSGSNASGTESLLDQQALAARQIMLEADRRMDPRVLRHLRGMEASRMDACIPVLSRSETLVFGDSMTGFAQVRVIGNPDAIKPLRFQACRILDGKYLTGEMFSLPELAASELAERLKTSPPAGATAIAYDNVTLNAQAQHALDIAASDGLNLPIDKSKSGYHGILFNANAGKDKAGNNKPPRKNPYQARVTNVSTMQRFAHGPRFATAEEAALARAKLLKSHPNKYK